MAGADIEYLKPAKKRNMTSDATVKAQHEIALNADIDPSIDFIQSRFLHFPSN